MTTQDDEPAKPLQVIPTRRVVTLCGSTRFRDVFLEVMKQETLAGRIVIPPGVWCHFDPVPEDKKRRLDLIHLDKIMLANEILVIDCLGKVCPGCGYVWAPNWLATCNGMSRLPEGGFIKVGCGYDLRPLVPAPYIGASTRAEIVFATKHKRKVRYLSRQ